MHPLRTDFPIFEHRPGLVYLDSASTTQKPARVIDTVAEYLRTGYANIHRGAYGLSEVSDLQYRASKEAVARLIGAPSHYEIVYSNTSTGAFNLLAGSLAKSEWLQAGDRVLLSIVEHHANIVPWLMLRDDIGIEVEFVGLDEQCGLDFEDFAKKLTPNTKVISMTGCSNVTGVGVDFTRLNEVLIENWDAKWGELPFRIMDASQLVPHAKLDVVAADLDFAILTGHKVWADTGIGVLWGKREFLKAMVPSIGGGGAINFVHTDGFEPAGLPFRFEPGTPNLTGAVSLLAAVEYFESIGGYSTLEAQEGPLVKFALEEFAKRKEWIRLIGPDAETLNNGMARAGVFSFVVQGQHSNDVADALATLDICVRAGHHCTEPFHRSLGLSGTLRMSISMYNTQEDLEKFFDALDAIASAT